MNTQNGFSISLIHDIPFNSPVLVFHKRNSNQSRFWKSLYKFLNILGELAIIELSSCLIQFSLILVKLYYNFIIELDKNFNKDIKNTLLETRDNFEYQEVLLMYFSSDISSTLVLSTFLISLILTSTPLLIFSILAKYGCGRL